MPDAFDQAAGEIGWLSRLEGRFAPSLLKDPVKH
jgi:hypothetical protein